MTLHVVISKFVIVYVCVLCNLILTTLLVNFEIVSDATMLSHNLLDCLQI